jgi:hypothetical protein
MWRCIVNLGPHGAGMALQCLGWWHSGGDGRTVPEVIGKTRPAGLTSRRRPRRSGVGGRTPFEGVVVLFRGGDVEEVRELAAQCHGITPAFPHSTRTAPGMVTQCRLVEQRRVMIPKRCQRAGVVGILL